MTTAAVYGMGSWGTAYAAVLADGGTTVRMWGRRAEVVEQVNAGSNEDYLPGIELPSGHHRDDRPGRGRRGGRHRRAGGALADPARQPRRLGRRSCPAERLSSR